MSAGSRSETGTVLSARTELLDPLPQPVFLIDLEDRIRYANPAAGRLLGYGPDELAGSPMEQLIPERARDRDSAGARLRSLRAMGESAVGTTFAVTARRRDGSAVPVEVTVGWADDDADPVALVCAQPIADQEQSSAVQRLAAVVESSADAILTKDLDGVITSWNRGARRMYGYRAEEIIGRPVSLLMDADRRHDIDEIMVHIRRGEAVADFETVRITKDGRALDVSLSVSPLRDPEGKLIGAATVARDITERKRASEQVRALLESAPDAVMVLDESGQIVLVNRRTEEMFGYSRADLIGAPARRLMADDESADIPAYREFLEGTAVDQPLERRARRADGRPFPVEVTFSRLRSDVGLLVYGSIRDITVRKRVEDELRRSNHDLEQFAYVASHDLSEPLRVIAGFVDLLARRYRGRLDEDADRFIGFVVSGVERLQALIDDLLAYSRAGRAEMEPRTVDLAEVVSDVLWALEPQIRERGVTVDVGELPTVCGEKAMLRQVFQNLISNAVKFSEAHSPCVAVSAHREGEGWRFDVSDNGPGIPPRYAERVFEMFQRLHGRDVPGSGMGLAIVKRLTERHGGRAWVSAAHPHGSVFHVLLPDHPPAA